MAFCSHQRYLLTTCANIVDVNAIGNRCSITAGFTNLTGGIMLLKLTTRVAKAMLAFTRYRISTLGIRKFVGEVTGMYAIDQLIDVAAEHSEWVKKHETALTAGLTLGMMGRNSLLNLVGKRTGLETAKVLFSKIPIVSNVSVLRNWIQEITVFASHSGFTLSRFGKEVFSLSVKDGKVAFAHTGGAATAALLAATFGGQIPTTKREWELTGDQLAIQLADVEYTMAEQELRSRLHDYSPITLISSGAMVISSFLNDYPNFSAERAVSIYSGVLSTEDVVFGKYSLEAFKDSDGDEIIRINGMYYKLEEQGQVLVMMPATPADGYHRPVSDDTKQFLYLIESTLAQVERDGGTSLMRVAETDRFMSTPFTVGQRTISLLLDINNPVPFFVMAKDSTFDSSSENLQDEIDEQETEALFRYINAVPALFGFETDDGVVFEEKVSKILPILGGSYRKGMIYLSDEVLHEGLGK